MPMETVRMLKRAFKSVFGYDPFQSEVALRTYMKGNKFEYEREVFTNKSGNNIEFVRVLSVKQVIIKMVKDLAENNML